jgi:hypothetical protein
MFHRLLLVLVAMSATGPTVLGGAMLGTISYGWLPDADANPLLDSVKHEFLGR